MQSLPFGATVPYRKSIERTSFRRVWNCSNVKSGGTEVGAFGHSSMESCTTLIAPLGVECQQSGVVGGYAVCEGTHWPLAEAFTVLCRRTPAELCQRVSVLERAPTTRVLGVVRKISRSPVH